MNAMIRWFAHNDVAANLLMVLIMASGVVAFSNIKQEIFPEFESNAITVSVVYPGATPAEAEESICMRIEEQIQGLDGVKQIRSTATENVGAVIVEVLEDADAREVLDDVKSRVDAIDTFPEDAERPVVSELQITRQVLSIALSGDTDERSLKELGQRLRDDIASLDGITLVDLVNVRPYEISVEISEEALRRHGLTMDAVAQAIRVSSLDLPGGSVKTEGGEILLRTKGQAYRGDEFEDIALVSRSDGTRLRLGDVGTVIDGFEDTDQSTRFNGNPSAMVKVYRVGDQAALEVAATVKEWVAANESRMPAGIDLTIWDDNSVYLKGRMDLMVRNGRSGLILVFLVLALFLRFRLAFWVSVGVPISFLGAIWFMPILGASINLISLFAFILVLGIVVDDAIVVGESIYTHQKTTKDRRKAAVDGTLEVALPVVFAVLTTIAAFYPLLNVPGTTGQIWKVIPLIVIPTLLFSMLESKLILPSHLAHQNTAERAVERFLHAIGVATPWGRFQSKFANGLESFIHNRYQPFLKLALRNRYATSAVGLAGMFLTVSLVASGFVRFVFFPPVEADIITATLTMPQGTSVDQTARAVQRIEDTAQQLRQELDSETPEGAPSTFRHLLASVGGQPKTAERAAGPGQTGEGFVGAHLGEVQIELAPSETRALSSEEISARWRDLTGAIPDATELSFNASLFSAGEALNVQMSSSDQDDLREATVRLKEKIAEYPGVYEIADSFQEGKQELKLSIKPEAGAYGITLANLARQVRQGFYGEEAQRIQRGRDDVKVMVRYPEEDRRSLGDVENMRVRTASGDDVPFALVANAQLGRGYSTINRVDRRRVINVTASVDQEKSSPNAIVADLTQTLLPTLANDYPGLTYSFEGEQEEQREAMGGLLRGFAVALLLIYALMAIPFKSYLHPFVIMSVIPFGLMGAIWGHLIMGRELSILSVCGMVALTGVVVNDSLVLVDWINRRRREGVNVSDAVHRAGVARFRPILLTSLTTFAGLLPMLLERSLQAQFLIPMAISLAFGVLFATFVTLLLVPASYLIFEDLLGLWPRAKAARAAKQRRGVATPERGEFVNPDDRQPA